jgi:RNA polymerase sigma-70 factor (ECF subfamily)
VVWTARNGDSAQAQEALNKLCTAYWRPLFYYLRRRGHRFEDARDLTQGFFAHLLQEEQLRHLKHQDGRFRSFLLTLLNHYVSDERDKAHAQKRGGGQTPVFLDALSEEERYRTEPVDGVSAELLFDRCWAETVLERGRQRLRDEYQSAGNGQLFDALHQLPPGRATDGPSCAELAARLGTTESAVTSALHRLRRRQAEIIREEVAQTVAGREDVDGEIRYLLEVVAR